MIVFIPVPFLPIRFHFEYYYYYFVSAGPWVLDIVIGHRLLLSAIVVVAYFGPSILDSIFGCAIFNEYINKINQSIFPSVKFNNKD